MFLRATLRLALIISTAPEFVYGVKAPSSPEFNTPAAQSWTGDLHYFVDMRGGGCAPHCGTNAKYGRAYSLG